MAGSFVSRAARALRDPWSLVVAGRRRGFGMGDRPAGRRRRAGRCRACSGSPRWSAAPSAATDSEAGRTRAATAAAGDRPGAAGRHPAGLPGRPRPAAAARSSRRPSRVSAVQAVEAARNAESVANRVARAVDAVDDAVGRAEGVARQMPRSGEVRASVQRMMQRRSDLLAKLTEAVDEVGEVYAKLLELSTTADLVGVRHRRRQRGRPGQRLAGRDPRGVRRTGGRRLHPPAPCSDRRPGRPPRSARSGSDPGQGRRALSSVGWSLSRPLFPGDSCARPSGSARLGIAGLGSRGRRDPPRGRR